MISHEAQASAIQVLQARYLCTMSGVEAERLNAEIQFRIAALIASMAETDLTSEGIKRTYRRQVRKQARTRK